jgi:hypothetical protein
MNKKLILPLVIGAGLIAYFLIRKKKTNFNQVEQSGGPRPQPTATTLSVTDTGDMSAQSSKQTFQSTGG